MKLGATVTDQIAEAEKCDCLACTLRAAFLRYRKEHGPDQQTDMHDVGRFVGELIRESQPNKGKAATEAAEMHMTILDYAIFDEDEATQNATEILEGLGIETVDPVDLDRDGVDDPTDEEIAAILKLEAKSRGRLH